MAALLSYQLNILQYVIGSLLEIEKKRSIHGRCSVRKGVLRNLARFTGKHLCHSLFLNKVGGLRPATLLKKRLWHMFFLVNFAKFLRTTFLQNTSGRLLLKKVGSYFFERKDNDIACLPKLRGFYTGKTKSC